MLRTNANESRADSGAAAVESTPEFSSFRDPAGFLFWRDGRIHRALRHGYLRHWQAAGSSGLLQRSVADGLLLPFEETSQPPLPDDCFAVLTPRQLPLVTYPYEWCFDQLRDAAILTLNLHLQALRNEMVLKDASAFNVQTIDGKPFFIDHLSFALLEDYGMWPAYGQFCRHFLAPLALMARKDISAGRLSLLHLDGIPLRLASDLMPATSWFSPGLLMHLHVHARFVTRYEGHRKKVAATGLKSVQLLRIAESLLAAVDGLRAPAKPTQWGDYTGDISYSEQGAADKLRLVRELVGRIGPRVLWDIGGNDGRYSRAIADQAGYILCLDADPAAINRSYRECRRTGIANVTPLLFDFTNPTPAAGFAGRERPALADRSRPDLIMMLALIHHLAITHHVPIEKLAQHLAGLTPHVLIEFVDRSDPLVERLLLNRPDDFADYTEAGFRAAFARYFSTLQAARIPGSSRTLYLMERRA